MRALDKWRPEIAKATNSAALKEVGVTTRMSAFWHKADIELSPGDVRFWGKADIAKTSENVRC